MRKVSVTILSLIFFDNAMAGVGTVFRDYSVRVARRSWGGKNRKKAIAKSLVELEEKLWGESFGDLSKSDIKGLVDSRFNPLDVMGEMERYRHNLAQRMIHNNDRLTVVSKERVFEIIAQHHIRSPIVLRWWDQVDFRNYVFLRVLKSDLTGNRELLLRWWGEAKVREDIGPVLFNQYIESSFREVEKIMDDDSSFDVVRAMASDPFLRTVLGAIGESDSFAENIIPVIEETFRRIQNPRPLDPPKTQSVPPTRPLNSPLIGYEPGYGT